MSDDPDSRNDLLAQRDQAEFKAQILEARLVLWEAACTAQMIAARAYIDALARTVHTDAALAARAQLELAIDSNAGELLLVELKVARERAARLEAALRQAAAMKSITGVRVIVEDTLGDVVKEMR